MKRVVGIGIGLLLVLVVGFSLMRARMRGGESSVIGDMGTMVSGQAAYASVNGGFYDVPACLEKPCIPGYDGPPFLGETLARLPDRGGLRAAVLPGATGGA